MKHLNETACRYNDITEKKSGHLLKGVRIFKVLFPLNYTLYLIFRELAIIGDIYRGQYKQRTPP